MVTGQLVFVLEDEEDVARVICSTLRQFDFETEHFSRGHEILRRIARKAPAICLVDLGLPDLDGLEVLRKLQESGTATIVLTGRADVTDRVLGLELGADDYIVKPFGFRELVARIRAVTRRTGAPFEHRSVLKVADLELDRRSRRASRAGRELPLTPREFDLLALLMEEAGAALPRTRIMEEVWDSHWYGPSKTLDVHVASLRKKLGDPRWIETVRAVGFRLGSPNGG